MVYGVYLLVCWLEAFDDELSTLGVNKELDIYPVSCDSRSPIAAGVNGNISEDIFMMFDLLLTSDLVTHN